MAISYQWTGINKQGKRVSGVVQAETIKEVQTQLNSKAIDVISIEKRNKLDLSHYSILKRKQKIKHKEILFFTRYLSTMLAAGLSLKQTLDILANEKDNPAMQNMVISIRKSISEGKTIAEAFAQFPQYFSELYFNLVKAGEKSGTLDKILLRLGNFLERSEALRRKIKKALIYPIAILTVAMAVSLILLIFVVPQFQKMFESFGGKLPVFTQMVVNLSDFLRAYWWIIIGVIVAGIWYLKKALKASERMQEFRDRLILRFYLIGPVIRQGIISRFARTLATTLEAGMPIVDSMNSMAPIMANRVYTKAVLQVRDDLIGGHKLSVALANTNLFPNLAIQMVTVGEASGKLSDMLNRVADYYEEEVNTVVDNLSSLLEPLIMAILGVIVGGFVVAMYLPIFRMGSLF